MTFRPTIVVVAVAIIPFVQAPTLAQAPHEDSAFGIFGAFAANEYGYFQGRMGFGNDQYWAWAENHFRALGAYWTRSNMQLLWDWVEPTLGAGYNWNSLGLTDGIVRRVYAPGNAVHWLGVFHEGGGPIPPPPPMQALRNPLSYPNEYSAFVRAAVERYDGDGIGDADANVRVKYWQAGNEIPGWQATGRSVQDYVHYVRMVRQATQQADPESKLVLIATTSGLGVDLWLTQIIDALAAERAFDVIDIHHWGAAQTWQMTGVPQYRQRLDSLGLTDVQIWSCEHGTWQGQPTNQPSQTEQDQARSLVKRYLYNLNNGLNKLFWNNLMEFYWFNGQSGSIFNSMGLITDGQGPGEDSTRFNTARVAYWTYQLLASRIDVDRSTRLGLMPEVYVQNQAYGYAYQWRNSSRKLYVLWSESGTRSVTFSVGTPTARLTNLITDRFGTILEQRDIAAVNGRISTDIGIDPVIIEELPLPLPGDFDGDGDVDLADFAQFEICFTGPGGTLALGCEPGDFDGDDDIDCDDWAQFVLAWTDPGQPPQLAQCASHSIPAVSQWGSASMALVLLIAARLVLRRGRSVRTP